MLYSYTYKIRRAESATRATQVEICSSMYAMRPAMLVDTLNVKLSSRDVKKVLIYTITSFRKISVTVSSKLSIRVLRKTPWSTNTVSTIIYKTKETNFLAVHCMMGLGNLFLLVQNIIYRLLPIIRLTWSTTRFAWLTFVIPGRWVVMIR